MSDTEEAEKVLKTIDKIREMGIIGEVCLLFLALSPFLFVFISEKAFMYSTLSVLFGIACIVSLRVAIPISRFNIGFFLLRGDLDRVEYNGTNYYTTNRDFSLTYYLISFLFIVLSIIFTLGFSYEYLIFLTDTESILFLFPTLTASVLIFINFMGILLLSMSKKHLEVYVELNG